MRPLSMSHTYSQATFSRSHHDSTAGTPKCRYSERRRLPTKLQSWMRYVAHSKMGFGYLVFRRLNECDFSVTIDRTWLKNMHPPPSPTPVRRGQIPPCAKRRR